MIGCIRSLVSTGSFGLRALDAPLVGATKAHHLNDAVAAMDLHLTDEEVTSLEEHYTPRQPTHYGSKSGY